jgi:hypothetical protein
MKYALYGVLALLAGALLLLALLTVGSLAPA